MPFFAIVISDNQVSSMKIQIDEVIKFLQDLIGSNNIKSNSDIFSDIGVSGDDFHEMIENYSEKYSVDMTKYLWYFHADEEGQNIGGIFFKPPYSRVKRIPVTPELLTEFANKGKWDIQYPEHEIPSKRHDLLINKVILCLLLILVLLILLKKWRIY